MVDKIFEDVAERLVIMTHLYHIFHDLKKDVHDCENVVCKQNMEILNKYGVSVPKRY